MPSSARISSSASKSKHRVEAADLFDTTTTKSTSSSSDLDKLFEQIPESLEVVKEKLKMFKQRAHDERIDMTKGISLLDVKIHSMASYISHLLLYCLAKVDGTLATPLLDDETESTNPSSDTFDPTANLDKIIHDRIILEKIRPLEAKLKYQIDKMMRASALKRDTTQADPLSFRPNPENLDVEPVEEDEIVETKPQDTGVYRPPKIAPKYYSETKTHITSRERKNLAKSRILADIREEISDAPMEEDASGLGYTSKDAQLRGISGKQTEIDRELEERERFEEDNFIRLTQSKRERKMRRDAAGSQGLLSRMRSDLDSFNDFADLDPLSKAVSNDKKFQRFDSNKSTGPIKKRKMVGEFAKAKKKMRRR